MALGADFQTLCALQTRRSDELPRRMAACYGVEVGRCRTMTALASNTAPFSGSQGIGFTVAAEASQFECWAQHPPELIFVIRGFFFMKPRRKNKRSAVRERVTGLDQSAAFQRNTSNLVYVQQKAETVAVSTNYRLNGSYELCFAAGDREQQMIAGPADFIMQDFCGALIETERSERGSASMPGVGHRGLALAIGDSAMARRTSFRTYVVVPCRAIIGLCVRETQRKQAQKED